MNACNSNQQFDFLDMLAVMAFVLQAMDYELTVKQSSNDDIQRELRQDMAELRRQNEAILHTLSKRNSDAG